MVSSATQCVLFRLALGMAFLSACNGTGTPDAPTTSPVTAEVPGNTTSTEATSTTTGGNEVERAVLEAYQGYFDAIPHDGPPHVTVHRLRPDPLKRT